jgi:hypothetical protein
MNAFLRPRANAPGVASSSARYCFHSPLLPRKVGYTALGRYSRAREHGDGRSVAQPFANSVH